MTKDRGVHAVIVTHRDLARAQRCAAFLGLSPDRVVIVSNVVPLRATAPWTVISPRAPQGYGANINLGVAHTPTGTRWLLLLNDDVELGPDTLELLLAAAEGEARVGALTPALHVADGRPQAVAFRHPTVRSELANVLAGPDLVRRMLRRGHSVVPAGRGVTYEDWVLGAAMLVRAAAFFDVGGFDERYFMYSEDTQFGLDLERAGWRSGVVHDAWALHVGAASTSEQRWTEMLAASRRRYVRENWSRSRFAALCLAWFVAQAWNVAYAAVRRPVDSGHAKRAAHVRTQLRHPPWR